MLAVKALFPRQVRERGGGSSGVEVMDRNCVETGKNSSADGCSSITPMDAAVRYPQQARWQVPQSSPALPWWLVD